MKLFLGRFVFAPEAEIPGEGNGKQSGAFFDVHPVFGRGHRAEVFTAYPVVVAERVETHYSYINLLVAIADV